MRRLGRDADQNCSQRLNLRINRIHRFHLADAKRTPSPAEKSHNQLAFPQKIDGPNQSSILICELKSRGLITRPQRSTSNSRVSDFHNCAFVDSLNLLWNILCNQFFAFSKDFGQRSNFRSARRLFQ